MDLESNITGTEMIWL